MLAATDNLDPTSWPALLGLVLGSTALGSLLTKVIDKSSARTEAVREGYADAARALNAWGQFPLRIRRRTDDDIETLRRLEELGAKIQADLAYSSGWVSSESAALGEFFISLLTILRGEVRVHAQEAWASPAAGVPSRMNLANPSPFDPNDPGGEIPAEWLVVQTFSRVMSYRFGWRRYLVPDAYLRRQILRKQFVQEVKTEMRRRSSRLLIQEEAADGADRYSI